RRADGALAGAAWAERGARSRGKILHSLHISVSLPAGGGIREPGRGAGVFRRHAMEGADTRLTPIIPLALAGALAVPAAAQTVDTNSLREISDIDLVSSDGERIGEVEDALIDASGMPVAVSVEINDGFLNLGDEDVILMVDQLTFENGQYT